MTIKILPEDMVRRCLWDHYVYYVLGSEKDAENILKENNLDTKVYTIYHPTEFVKDEFMFTPKKFTLAIKKKIIQIGAWMRDIHAINKLNVDNCPLFLDKYVLIGKKMDIYYSNENNNDEDKIFTDDDDSIICNPSITDTDSKISIFSSQTSTNLFFSQINEKNNLETSG